MDTRLFTLNTLAVPPPRKHLIAALEAAERHNDPEVKVFRWLLPLTMLKLTERSWINGIINPEMKEFNQWAANKQAEEKRRGL